VLLGQDRADEPDDRGSVGKMPTTSVLLRDRAVESFVRVVGPDLLGKPVKARMSAGAATRCSASCGTFSVRASTTIRNCELFASG
jgi:hypothetical protein